MQRLFSDSCGKQTDVHGRGAKLEGERVPLVVKENLTAIHMKAEVNLLVYFQNGYEKRFSQQESTNEGFPLVRTMPGDQESAKDRCSDKEYVERAVRNRHVHLRVKQG